MLDTGRRLENALLCRLPARERRGVLAACEEVEVTIGQSIYQQGAPIRQVYFPLDSMFSELTPGGTPAVEAFLTGFEGMVGHVVVLGARRAALQCGVQGSGRALRMKASEFAAAAAASPAVRRIACANAYYQIQQTARNVFCMRHHEIAPRLARWLLMAGDRHRARRFDVTHHFLAAMLGTRRAGVTVAAAALQARGFIRYRRREIEILDRKALEGFACDCYAFSVAAPKSAYRATER